VIPKSKQSQKNLFGIGGCPELLIKNYISFPLIKMPLLGSAIKRQARFEIDETSFVL